MDPATRVLIAILTVNFASLIAIATTGYKVVRFFNRIEFKTDLMWTDYEYRVKGRDRRHFAHDSSNEISHDDGTEGK